MNFTNKLRVFFLIIILMGLCYSATAQTKAEVKYKIEGNEIVKVQSKKDKPIKTGLVYRIKDSVHTVWKSPKGKYYIWRVSKKTKRAYKQYFKLEE